MLAWLKAPALPRPFVLDLLDFVLGNSARVFHELPAFEHALLVRGAESPDSACPACALSPPVHSASILRLFIPTTSSTGPE